MATNNGYGSSYTTRTPAERSATEENLRQQPMQEPKHKGSKLWVYGIILGLVLIGILVFVFIRKHTQDTKLRQATTEMAVPTVMIVHPETGSGEVKLVLPGTVQAYMESSVYAQIGGYVTRWMVDIGSPVTEGQVLAEIDAPVAQQNLKQSQANLGQSQANLALAKTTAQRYNGLLLAHAVSQQDADNQNGNVAVQEANVAAAQAAVTGIQQSLAFREVRAPFAGVITARRVDVGDLVTAAGGTSSNSGTASAGSAASGSTNSSSMASELFRVAQTKILRVYVSVPEHYSAEVAPGATAAINLASNPLHSVNGTLVRTSDAIDPTSLTLLAELDINNADGKLLPGGYAQVHFDLHEAKPPLLVPGNTLIFRAQGTQLGVVDGDNTVHLKDIQIGRDFGTKLEVIQGLEKDDRVILNPSDSLINGLKVQVKEQEQKPPPKPQA